MPRSGTTLVEQIISSHTKVFGGDEISLLPELIEKNFKDVSNIISSDKLNICFIKHFRVLKRFYCSTPF